MLVTPRPYVSTHTNVYICTYLFRGHQGVHIAGYDDGSGLLYHVHNTIITLCAHYEDLPQATNLLQDHQGSFSCERSVGAHGYHGEGLHPMEGAGVREGLVHRNTLGLFRTSCV